ETRAEGGRTSKLKCRPLRRDARGGARRRRGAAVAAPDLEDRASLRREVPVDDLDLLHPAGAPGPALAPGDGDVHRASPFAQDDVVAHVRFAGADGDPDVGQRELAARGDE